MTTAYLAVTLTAIAANGFSGIAALLHFRPILPGMAKAGVPVSWLRFPIRTLKTLGAVGLAAGLAFRPLGLWAAIGLVLFFVCALHTHVRAADTRDRVLGAQHRSARGVAAVAGTQPKNSAASS
jgi:hypothetical protein